MEQVQFRLREFQPEVLSGVIAGAEMTHRKMGKGDNVSYRGCQIGSTRHFSGDYGFPVWVNGCMPKDHWYFGMRAGKDTTMTINYKRSPKIGLAVYPPGAEVDYVCDAPELWSVFCVSDEKLQRVFRQLHDRDLEMPANGVRVIPIAPPDFKDFSATQEGLLELCGLHSVRPVQGTLEEYLDDIFVRKLALLLGGSCARKKTGSGQPASEQLALQELHKVTKRWLVYPTQPLHPSLVRGVNARVLQRATKRAYGVSPEQWMKLVRLNSAYRALAGSRAVSVTDVCQRYFFSNGGRFAHDYEELFGEYPLDTFNQRRMCALQRGLVPGAAGPNPDPETVHPAPRGAAHTCCGSDCKQLDCPVATSYRKNLACA